MSSKLPVVLVCLLFAHGALSSPALQKKTLIMGSNRELKELQWWQRTVVYQVYPRSFQDSDGDGVGDINGITSKLDYFVDLGIESIWISPIYKSPMVDFGYDISNFTDIEPQFGTMDDFRNMAAEFRKRDLKLIMDMVPNHSSNLHAWFNLSVNRVEPYTDFYVWKDPKGFDANGKPIEPNNWMSVFGGSAWEWNEKRQQFYLHQFAVEQVDLNFENINVRNAMLAVFKFWLDIGVDGFRVDAAPFLYEDQRFLDQKENPDRDPATLPNQRDYWINEYVQNLPQVLDFLADCRQLIDIYSAADGRERCVMIEAYIPDESTSGYYGTEDHPVSHFPFNFHLLWVRPENTASEVLHNVNVWEEITPPGSWGNFVLGNHDQKRIPLRWTTKGKDAANMLSLLLKGTAVTYYGEEIGMEDTIISWEDTVDPQACNTDPERYHQYSRDPARTPMQWNNRTNAGFSTTTGKTWLPINENYKTLNLEAQLAAEESHIKVYKALTTMRKRNVWKYGGYQSKALNNDRVIAYSRIAPKDVDTVSYFVLVNFSDDSVTVDATSLDGVPPIGFVYTRSVGFTNQAATIGSSINNRAIQLGPRDAIVVQFSSV